MKNVVLGTIAGLAVGTIASLAYSHFLGDGKQLADLQAQLDEANADLANLKKDKQNLSKETTGVSDQVDQLASSNAELRKQLDDLKNAPQATPPPPINATTLAGMIGGMFRGGFQAQQRMFLLKTRLKLTPEQEATIKAAMDADQKARRDLMRQMFQNGGKIDPAAAASANTLDATLAKTLTPAQMTQYQQVQADEKASRADTSTNTQINQIAPLLQLSDSQKDQVYSALYPVSLNTPDPMSLMTNPNAPTIIQQQAAATQAALAKVLSTDQMALYQQSGASFNMGGFGGFGGRNRNGGGGNGGGNTAAPAAAPAPAAAGQ
jgi:hypothetical protein